jgi:hypothetical protein
MHSKSPSETLHRVRCLSEHRVRITRPQPIAVTFEAAPEAVISIEPWRKLTPAERVKRWREKHNR